MDFYRIILTPTSPLGTPLHSDTLFGHVCWAIRYTGGVTALSEFLDLCREKVFVLSDGMPEGFLPRPICMPLSRRRERELVTRHFGETRIEGFCQLKRLRKTRLIPESVFRFLRDNFSEESLLDQLLTGIEPSPRWETVRQAHNRINRLTGRTPDEGGLYFSEAEVYKAEHKQENNRLCVFAATDFIERSELRRLMEYIGTSGYGKDASTGKGQFEVSDLLDARDLFANEGTRRMSLSRGLLTETMEEPLYRLFTKYGRLGGERAGTDQGPFKRPVVLTEPGATFVSDDPFPGELVADVHPRFQDVVHQGRHLTVSFTEVSS